MMLRNFLYRVGEAVRASRARIFKALGIVVAVGALILLITTIVERVQRDRYEKRVQALSQQIREADDRAKNAQARADAKAKEIMFKEAELHDFEARAQAAEVALQKTRKIVVPLKEKYEEAHNTPISAVDISCADLCAKLADLQHPCQ